jgi:tRNA1(Val) A37 N6-methylase TrmN6
MAHQSIIINNLDNIELINDNIKNWQNYFKPNSFDIITCNPPYFKYMAGSIINDNNIKSIARHEIEITLEEVIQISSQLLKDKGSFYLVHKPERLAEILNLLQKYHFGIKRIDCCYHNYNSECSIILIEAMKNGKNNIKISKPIITNKYRRYTNEINSGIR